MLWLLAVETRDLPTLRGTFKVVVRGVHEGDMVHHYAIKVCKKVYSTAFLKRFMRGAADLHLGYTHYHIVLDRSKNILGIVPLRVCSDWCSMALGLPPYLLCQPHILTPRLRATLTALMAVYPTHSCTAPALPPTFITSSSRLSRNVSVSLKLRL